ncbi:MAG TPA: hypothetical protein VFI24_04475 [Pyrinomonadaceae bacterium]|nr:hypothetical protein [Pyrinomonadaceae bacterium]
MYRLLDKPELPFHPLYINLEHILTAGDFMVELMAVLLRDRHFARIGTVIWQEAKGFGKFIRDLSSMVDVGGIKVQLRESTDVPQHWLSYGERVMSSLSKQDPRLLLLLDEFAVMIDHIAQENPRDAEQLLRWFRAVRIAPGTMSRFVIGGSINLVATLDSMGLVDTVNDLSIERLKPFDSAIAERFIRAIFASRRMRLDASVLKLIMELVGTPIPYLLAVFLTAILDRQRATGKKVTGEMVQAAFEEDLLGGATSITFQHYRSRIDQYYAGFEPRSAKVILGMLSRSETPIRNESLYELFVRVNGVNPSAESNEAFKLLMNRLENDFYIVNNEGSYDFFSRVLKLWWKTHYGFQIE